MENYKSNTIVPMLVGTVIGVTLGILFAPDKGKVTREKIKTKTQDAAHNISEQIVNSKEEITKFVQDKKAEFEKKIEDKISNLSYKAEDIINKLEDKLEDLKKKNATLH